MAFDPLEALKELRSSMPATVGRKLSFVDQCAIYAARKAAKLAVLAQAFGVTKATVSSIANCRHAARSARLVPWRYHDVAKEFERLGQLEFDRRYYTDEIHTRIMRLRFNRPETGDDQSLLGPNPRADKFAHANFGPFEVPNELRGGTLPFRVDWTTPEIRGWDRPISPGWWFKEIAEDGKYPYPVDYRGREGDSPIPFRTSAEAYDGAFAAMGQDSPRPKPGRPKAKP